SAVVKKKNKSNKTAIHEILSGDHGLILNKVYENKLITQRECNNLKSINSANAETYVNELVDKIMNKGEKTCKDFLNLLQTDGAIKETFPQLASLQLSCTPLLSEPVQVSSCQHGKTRNTVRICPNIKEKLKMQAVEKFGS
uniref:CARD domain-containing protein n=1 Tax=Maylandia zebra TaxID=106582 RepID=A0A3P9BYB4_9CICH